MPDQRNQLTIWYLVLVSLLDFMGLGVVVAIFPHLLLANIGDILSNHWSHEIRLTLLGLFLAVYPLGQFFGAAILGKLSDIHGRRKLMIITQFGTIIAFILSAYSIVIGSGLLLFVSRLVAGLFAGNIAIAQASIADLSTADTKAKNLTLVQIALGLSWVIGPPAGGWLSNYSIGHLPDYATPFFFMALLLFVLFVYTVCCYQDTLKIRSTDRANIFLGLKEIAHAYSHKKFRIAFYIWTVFVAGWWLFEAFLPAYLLKNFDFSSAQIGGFLASMGATYALFQFIVVRPISKHMKAENMVRYFLYLSGLSVLSIAFIHNNVIILHIAITLFVTSMGFAFPGLITSISNLASEKEQGKIMGNISSVQALATVLVMMIGGYLDTIQITVTVIIGGLLLIFSWLLFSCNFRMSSSLENKTELSEKLVCDESHHEL